MNYLKLSDFTIIIIIIGFCFQYLYNFKTILYLILLWEETAIFWPWLIFDYLFNFSHFQKKLEQGAIFTKLITNKSNDKIKAIKFLKIYKQFQKEQFGCTHEARYN